MALVTAAPAYGQARLPLISVEFDPATYGIEGPERIARGRVSIAYAPEGPRLGMYYLRDTPPPRVEAPAAPVIPEPVAGGAGRERQTALWVWNTAELLTDASERSTFLDFIEGQGITRVFLYLAAAEGERASAGYIPFAGSAIGPLLAELRERGALAYALDGDKDYVLSENHPGVFRTVERLVEHNRLAPPEQRFHGVRYDIEPYLVPGFQGPGREALLNAYVELIAGVAERAHRGGLAVAVDIPFWFDAPDEETGVYMEADLAGERKRILEHVMSLVDDIAIMDYRTSADGPDGALAHALGEMDMGERTGAGVFVGVETTRLIDEDLHTFFGPARDGLPTRPGTRWLVLEQGQDGRTRIWVVDGEEALTELASKTRDAVFLRHWPAGRPIRIAADKQSFHNLGRERMEAVTGRVVRQFAGREAFLGLAFHDYRGLRELLGRN